MKTLQLGYLAVFAMLGALVTGCGLISQDECKEEGGTWVCVDSAPGPQKQVCVCDVGENDAAEDYGPDPLPW